MRILKFPLEITDHQVLRIPPYSQILSVQDQRGVLTLWAKCPSGDELEDVHIAIIATGPEFWISGLQYIATVQMQTSGLVWHVFRREPIHVVP